MKTLRRLQWLLLLIVVSPTSANAQPNSHASLIVLRDSGATRDGVPVVVPDPDAARIEPVLARGYSGRLLRLYALEQEYLRRKTGQRPEPAYLVLSNRQGGFPKFGFYLGDQKMPTVGWVDLHRTSRLSGRFGAMDQIYPHELLHVILRQLAGPPRRSGSNQMHAVGVRTDPVVAFNEGFAEHAQIMAVDDPDAMPDTAALKDQPAIRAQAEREVAAYARDLERRWWPIPASRLRFLLWFSAAEQVQRYYAVKDNLFARFPAMPERMLANTYRAYLYQSVVPGTPGGAAKRPASVFSTDGGVAHLCWRLMTDAALQQRYREAPFYDAFGVSADAVTPLENVYLKLFAVLHEARPGTTLEMLHGWARIHADDAADVARVAAAALLGQPLPDGPELWLANDALVTGTSLFDQFRALPRVHTFDANAALPIDWLTVPGVTSDVADRLIANAPYPSMAALLKSSVLSPAVQERIASMAAAASSRMSGPDDEEPLSLSTLVMSYVWRIATIGLLATVAGALLARRAGVRRSVAAVMMGLVATMFVIALAWVIDSPAWYPIAAPVVLCGLPWALWRLARQRRASLAAQALVAWAAASVPAMVMTIRW